MRNANLGAALPPVPFKLIEDEPIVVENDGDTAWSAWDSAVRQLDAKTEDGRALALMEMPA